MYKVRWVRFALKNIIVKVHNMYRHIAGVLGKIFGWFFFWRTKLRRRKCALRKCLGGFCCTKCLCELGGVTKMQPFVKMHSPKLLWYLVLAPLNWCIEGCTVAFVLGDAVFWMQLFAPTCIWCSVELQRWWLLLYWVVLFESNAFSYILYWVLQWSIVAVMKRRSYVVVWPWTLK